MAIHPYRIQLLQDPFLCQAGLNAAAASGTTQAQVTAGAADVAGANQTGSTTGGSANAGRVNETADTNTLYYEIILNVSHRTQLRFSAFAAYRARSALLRKESRFSSATQSVPVIPILTVTFIFRPS